MNNSIEATAEEKEILDKIRQDKVDENDFFEGYKTLCEKYGRCLAVNPNSRLNNIELIIVKI